MSKTHLINMPALFPGTPEEIESNIWSHDFVNDRCMECDCRPWGRVATWPCGQEPPRVMRPAEFAFDQTRP